MSVTEKWYFIDDSISLQLRYLFTVVGWIDSF